MTETIRGTTVAVLRPAKLPKPAPDHICVVTHGQRANRKDKKAIIQCSCGKRYKCREDFLIYDRWMWVRRWLPWPPKRKGV